MRFLFTLVGALTLQGCTHNYLRHNVAAQVSTLNELLHEQVLDNIALFECVPGALPAFSMPSTSTGQCTDSQQGTLALTWNPTTLVQEVMNANAQRQMMENWGMAPVVDPGKLRNLRCGFQALTCGTSLSLVTLQEGIDYDVDPSYPHRICASTESCCSNCVEDLIKLGFLTGPKTGARKGHPLDFCCEIDAQNYLQKLNWEISCKLPTCWYGVGGRCNVPRAAKYVGRHGPVYVWVLPENVDFLTRSTISMMDLATRVSPAGSKIVVRRKIETSTGFVEFSGEAKGDISDLNSDLMGEFGGDEAVQEKINEIQSRIEKSKDATGIRLAPDILREAELELRKLRGDQAQRKAIRELRLQDAEQPEPQYQIDRVTPYTPFVP